MAKNSVTDGKAAYISPSVLADIKAELEDLSVMEPGAKPVKEAIEELLPIIRGCRARGHSWNRIAASFQNQGQQISAVVLRRHAYELDPSLKGPTKNLVPKAAPGEAKKSKDKDKSDDSRAAVNF